MCIRNVPHRFPVRECQRSPHYYIRRDRRNLQNSWIDGKLRLLAISRTFVLHVVLARASETFMCLSSLNDLCGSLRFFVAFYLQAGSTAVHDTVVNQLLSKIDGVDELNNIFVIGKCRCIVIIGFRIYRDCYPLLVFIQTALFYTFACTTALR